MLTIKSFNQRFQKINLNEAVQESVKAKADVIANLQAIQLSKGQTKQGGELPYYSQRSIDKFGKTPGPWKLRSKGDLYRALKVIEVNPTGWQITTDSESASLIFPRLEKKGYKRTDVLGLNEETRSGGSTNPALATEILQPQVIIEFEKQTGLKLK